MRVSLVPIVLVALLAHTCDARWSIPSSILSEANARPAIKYDDAPNWNGQAGCSGTFTSGAAALKQFILARWPDAVSSIGGYSCRRNTGNTAKTSVHGSGRALDIMIPTKNGGADPAKGDPIANWLVKHCAEIGVQYLIWDRMRYSCSRNSNRFKSYGGPNPHVDHLHVEVNAAAGAKSGVWWSDTNTEVPIAPPPNPNARAPSIAPPISGEGYPGYQCHSRGGTCMSHAQCQQKGKQTVSGLCPGDSSIKCCIGLCNIKLPSDPSEWAHRGTSGRRGAMARDYTALRALRQENLLRKRRMEYSEYSRPEDVTENRIACTAFAISTVFEHGAVSSQQAYEKVSVTGKNNVVFGRFSFALSSGSLYKIVRLFCDSSANGAAALCQGNFLSRMESKDASLADDTSFKAALAAAGRLSGMQQLQDSFTRRFYFNEGRRLCDMFNLKSPLALAFCFDTALTGGLNMILNRAKSDLRGVPGINGITEKQFVHKAAGMRKTYLEKILGPGAAALPVSRPALFESLADQGQVDLRGEIPVKGVAVPGTDMCTSPAGGAAEVVRRNPNANTVSQRESDAEEQDAREAPMNDMQQVGPQ